MSPELPLPRSSSSARPASPLPPFERAFVALVLATLTWGTFAFGSVYPWAFTILSAGCAVTGAIGLLGGRRTFGDSRLILMTLGGIAGLGLLQLVPLPLDLLSAISPGTLQFLTRYDFRFAMAAGAAVPDGATGLLPAAHAISLAPEATSMGLALLAGFLLLLTGALRITSKNVLTRLASGIVGLGALLALMAIIQYAVLGDDVFSGMRIYGVWRPENPVTTPFGPYVNRNHFAGWMLMALPIGMALMLRELEQRRVSLSNARAIVWLSSPEGGRFALTAIAVALMLLSLVMTRSRSGLGGLVAIIAMLGVIAMRRFGARALGGVAAAVLGIALVFALLSASSVSVLGRNELQLSPLSMRFEIWRVALAIARDFPFFGAGLNAFGRATLVYQASGPSHHNEAHNEYLQLLAEGGAVMAILVAVGGAALWNALRRRFSSDRDLTDVYWIRVGVTTGLVAIALQSFMEFSLQMAGNAALFTTLLSMALYSPQRRRSHGASAA